MSQPGPSGYMIRKNKILEILNSLSRSKRQGANIDVNVVMKGWVGREKQELSSTKVQMEAFGRFTTTNCSRVWGKRP